MKVARLFNSITSKFPRTDFHEMNLDWVLKKIRELENKVLEAGVKSFKGRTGYVQPMSGDYSVGMITGLQNALNNKADKSEVAINLAKPTLTSIITMGITCTSNGDGTYTLNGTASSTARIKLQSALALKAGTYRLIGTPSNTPSTSSYIYYTNSTTNFAIDRGSGATFTLANDTTADVYLQAFAGDTFNNIVFKPMLTTDLTATYDSFVPYTGNSGRLNADVAEIRKEVDNVTPIPITFKPEATPTGSYTDCKKIGNVVYIQTMFNFTASETNLKIIGSIPAEYVKTARLMLSACHNNATCIPVVIRPTTGELEFWLNRPAGTTYGYTLTGSYTLN